MSKITKGLNLGKATEIQNCCREIRIVDCSYIGQILEGFNTVTEKQEKWIVIRKDKRYGKSIVQQIKP